MPRYLLYLFLLVGNFSIAQENEQKDSGINLSAKECIARIIAVDDSLGTIRNHACETGTLSMSIKTYVWGIEKLNFKNCPAGFKNAFAAHQKAWIAILKITDKYPGIRGEMHALFDQLEKGDDAVAFKKYLKKIWDTWAGIEKYIKSP